MVNSLDALTPAQIASAVDTTVRSRRSVRAFLPTPVPRAVLEEILSAASHAPSGANTQPWQVYVLTGDAKQALSRDIVAAYLDPEISKQHTEEYHYYPEQWKEPYLARRRKVGWDLYGLLGIAKTDKARMQEQQARNYHFFDAPVGIIFTIDRIMQQGSWLDYGMFMQSVMVIARARGLDTCPQASFSQFHTIIATHLRLKPEQQVVCGMSLGYEDKSKVENQLATEREPISGFATFLE